MLPAKTKNVSSRSCGFLTLTLCGSLAPTLEILTPLPQLVPSSGALLKCCHRLAMHCVAACRPALDPLLQLHLMLPALSSTLSLPSLGRILLPALTTPLLSHISQHLPWQMRALGFGRPSPIDERCSGGCRRSAALSARGMRNAAVQPCTMPPPPRRASPALDPLLRDAVDAAMHCDTSHRELYPPLTHCCVMQWMLPCIATPLIGSSTRP